MKISRQLLGPYFFFWARLVLRKHRPCIVGITGSVGKTTTKEIVAAVLMHRDAQPLVGAVWKSRGNMNDFVGLPLAILGLRMHSSRLRSLPAMCAAPLRAVALATFAPYPKILVLEYALTPWGESGMAQMVELATPTVGVVTAIGPAHLEFFDSIDQIAQAKSPLVRAVPPSGLVVLGQDNSYASNLDRDAAAPVVKVPGRGRELAKNAARVVARYFGISEEIIDRALSECGEVKGRLNLLELGPVTIIDDAFNASPLSMRLGLDTLAERAKPFQRKVAILGAMAELGADSPRYHAEIGEYARDRADVVIGVRDLAQHYRPDYWFPNSKECAESLSKLIRRGDCLLVKGSHSVHLDRVLRELKRIAVDDLASEHAPLPGN